MRVFRSLFCVTAMFWASNVGATSVIVDHAYYYPEIPKILAEGMNYEDHAICTAAYTGALEKGALITSSNLVTDSFAHPDFLRAAYSNIADAKIQVPLTDADEKYLFSLLLADDGYVYTNRDIMFLVKRGVDSRPEHRDHVYDAHFERCKAKVDGAISEWLSRQKVSSSEASN